MSALSLHIIVDNASDQALDRALAYLQHIHAPLVNIGGGAQLDRAMSYVTRVRSALPTCKIFFRHLDPDDTGIWTKLNPEQWIASRVTPRLEWCRQNDIVYVTDNESSGDNSIMQRYVAWQVEVMSRLHTLGLHAAVGRFATGNIGESQYPLLKPMFDAMQAGDYFSPNEYVPQPERRELASGNINRYHDAWNAYGKALPTAIGEYGIAKDYQARAGWRTTGMNAQAYADYLIGWYKDWYLPNGVSAFIYCIGGFAEWQSFQLDNDVLTALERWYDAQPPPVPTPLPPPAQTPEFDYGVMQSGHIEITKVGITNLNMRRSPSIAADVWQWIITDDKVHWSTHENTQGGYRWHKAFHVQSGKTGYVAETGNYQFVPDNVTAPLPPLDKDARRRELVKQLVAIVEELETLG